MVDDGTEMENAIAEEESEISSLKGELADTKNNLRVSCEELRLTRISLDEANASLLERLKEIMVLKDGLEAEKRYLASSPRFSPAQLYFIEKQFDYVSTHASERLHVSAHDFLVFLNTKEFKSPGIFGQILDEWARVLDASKSIRDMCEKARFAMLRDDVRNPCKRYDGAGDVCSYSNPKDETCDTCDKAAE